VVLRPSSTIPSLRGIYQFRGGGHFPLAPIRSPARWVLRDGDYNVEIRFLNFQGHTKSVNSKPGATQQFTRLPSPGCGPLCQATWFDDLHWILIRVVQVQGPSRRLRLSLWMESFSFASPRPENRAVAPAWCQLSSARQSGELPAAVYTGWQQEVDHGERPQLSLRRRAARLKAGAVPFPVEAPSPGGASTPNRSDQPLHLRFQRICVSAICRAQVVCGRIGFFTPTSWENWLAAKGSPSFGGGNRLNSKPVSRREGRSRKKLRMFQG